MIPLLCVQVYEGCKVCDLADQLQAVKAQQDQDRAAFKQQLDTDRATFQQQLRTEQQERRDAAAAQQKQLDSLARVTIVPLIINVAVQALKYASGDQPKPGLPASTTWQTMVRQKDPRARAFIVESFGRSSSKKHWAAQLDQLIDTRNSQQHPETLAQLQDQVARALQLANEHAAARAECSTALYVLEHFASLKQHFQLV